MDDNLFIENKVWQEFHCNDCNGYWRVKINMALNMRCLMVCPNCGRKHPRYIKDGKIVENASMPNAYEEEIYAPKSAYSKESYHQKMIAGARSGVVIQADEDLKKSPFPEGTTVIEVSEESPVDERTEAQKWRDAMMRERWLEIYGGNQ